MTSHEFHSPFDQIIYDYVVSCGRSGPNPLRFLEEERVHYLAAFGPRTPDEASHILETERLLQLLTELWTENPPTAEVREKLDQTDSGRQLLKRALS